MERSGKVFHETHRSDGKSSTTKTPPALACDGFSLLSTALITTTLYPKLKTG